MEPHQEVDETDLGVLATSNLIRALNRGGPSSSAAGSDHPHICTTCGIAFARESNLIRHIEESYEAFRACYCWVYKRKFKRDCHLRRHEIVHTRNADVVYGRVAKGMMIWTPKS